MKRSIRIFATKEDLQNIFCSLQEKFQIYYVPTYSDEPFIQINDITEYSFAAEPPVQCGESHLSRLTEPLYLLC